MRTVAFKMGQIRNMDEVPVIYNATFGFPAEIGMGNVMCPWAIYDTVYIFSPYIRF